MPNVSVIIPAYNAADYIREAVDSALSQTYGDFEVLVVDDGSTDDTPEILDLYGGRIRVIRQHNLKRAAACNRGAQEATGEWLAFLDADDVWLPNKLSRQVEKCGEYVISHTNSVFFGDGLREPVLKTSITPQFEGRVLARLLLGNFITGSSVMLRRDVFLGYDGFDPTYPCVQDWPLWLKICAEHELGYVEEPLVRYRVHAAATSRKARSTLPAHLRVLREAFRDYPKHNRRDIRRRAFGNSYLINAMNAAESGDWRFSIYCATQSLAHCPAVGRAWKTAIKASLIPFGVKY